jgi:sugar phosphate isomerase/epimerase
MKVNYIGINVPGNHIDGRRDRLEGYLAYIQEIGYAQAELPAHGLNVIINGELVPKRVKAVKQALSRFDLRRSVHAPNRTNLAFGPDLDMEYKVLEGCVRFCHEVGANILVYHSGLQALDAARAGRAPLPDADALARGAEQEVAALRHLAPLAADLGVVIAVENGDPHLWEYAVLKAHGKSPEELSTYHARLCVAPIVAQLQAINHPSVGMTLDLAHLHIAAHTIGFDYLEAVTEAVPWVRHLHINDNFGRLDVGFDAEGDRLPNGEADLHLPPGWGKIPFVDAFDRLEAYNGDLILELKTRYQDHFAEALDNARQLLS